MELTLRDWMVIVGVLLIVAVLVDAYRRVRNERRNTVRMSRSVGKQDGAGGDGDLTMFRELPNGGARVVERRDIIRVTRRAEAAGSSDPEPEPEPEIEAQGDDDAPPATDRVESPDEDVPLVSGINSLEEGANLDWLDSLTGEPRAHGPGDIDAEPEDKLNRNADPEVFMVNVVARDSGGFHGDDIMQILLACDLRFGDMNFFHRHELEAGKGPIQFSVANMMQPGVFDIDNMAELRTPGLVFFLTLPGPENMIQAYDYMLETAQAVARNLGGDVLDESRSVLTRQTSEHARAQIRDLERRLLARDGD